jgi:2-deoxy-D-gluconate 3-dehydrogenase
MFELTGKVALVIGSGETAIALAQAVCLAGAATTLVGSDAASLHASVDRLNAAGCSIEAIVADVSDKAQAVSLAEQISGKYGKIDVLINAWEQFERARAVDIEPAAWQQTVRIHIKGVFLACQAIGLKMLKQGEGSIINLSSVAGSYGIAESVAFAACKGGVDQLTRVLGAEWIKRGVRVNAISTWSDGLREYNDALLHAAERIPLGRYTQPSELAGIVVYMASTASGAMSGQIVHIDGGFAAI